MSDSEKTLQWQQLVTPGHVWQARLNRLTWVGAVVLTLFALSMIRDVHGNTFGLREDLARASNGEPATWLERFRAQPWPTIKGTFTGEGQSSARPQLHLRALRPVPVSGIDPATLMQFANLDAFVAGQLDALRAGDDLACGFVPVLSGIPWINQMGADVPLCYSSATGDTVWMAAVVAQESAGAPSVPWLGVFHEGPDGWVYRNVQLSTPSALLPERETISPEMVAYQVAEDFPNLVVANETPNGETP